MLMPLQVPTYHLPWGKRNEPLQQDAPPPLALNPNLFNLESKEHNRMLALKRKKFFENLYEKNYKREKTQMAYNSYQQHSNKREDYDQMMGYKPFNSPPFIQQPRLNPIMEQNFQYNTAMKTIMTERVIFKHVQTQNTYNTTVEPQNKTTHEINSVQTLPDFVLLKKKIKEKYNKPTKKRMKMDVMKKARNNFLKLKRIENKIRDGQFGVLDSLTNFREKLRKRKRKVIEQKKAAPSSDDVVFIKAESAPFLNVPLAPQQAASESSLFPLPPSKSTTFSPSSPLSCPSFSFSSSSPSSSSLTTSCSSSPLNFGICEDIDHTIPLKKRKSKFLKSFFQNEDVKIRGSTSEAPNKVLDAKPRSDSCSSGYDSGSEQVSKEDAGQPVQPNRDSALHIAVRSGNVVSAKYIIADMNKQHVTTDVYNHHKQTPLHLCILLNNVETMQHLLQGGASCNVPDADGNSTLHLAIKMKNIPALDIIANHSRVLIDDRAKNKNDKGIFDCAVDHNIPSQFIQNLLVTNVKNLMLNLKNKTAF